MLKKLLVVPVVAGLVALSAFAGSSTPRESDLVAKAKAMAVKMDRALDSMKEPEFVALDLEFVWPYEILPYLEYEGLTTRAHNPQVIFEPFPGDNHAHVAGYTYCQNEVFLNIRYINWVSSWYDEPEALATLIHEIVHTQGGDFCAWESEVAESRTQLGTLEILAAMANHENPVALYALLDELRSISMNVVLLDALERNDLDSYREFRAEIFQDAVSLARFEKSMRYWATRQLDLRAILNKYSVSVFKDFQDGQFKVDLPHVWYKDRHGDGLKDTVLLDDLMYVIANAEEMAADSGK